MSHDIIFLAGLAGLVAGATSMAAGEYVSVSSQQDIEKADLKTEKRELERNPKYEREELAQIYVARGLEQELAREVARQLMEKDALGAHAQDELGISKTRSANPLQAALASAASFTLGGLLPLLGATFSPVSWTIYVVVASSLLSLAILGAVGAKLSGVGIPRPTLRVLFWGALSMAFTAICGHFYHVNP